MATSSMKDNSSNAGFASLVYDWWPLIDERRQIRRILDAPVSVRYERTVPAAVTS